MRFVLWPLAPVALAALLLTAGRDVPDVGEGVSILAAKPDGAGGGGGGGNGGGKGGGGTVASCTSPEPDNGAYSLTGIRLPGQMVYHTNRQSFPSYLTAADVQAAIDSSFAEWDSETAAALFANGGTTSATVGAKDGVNTVGFGPTGSSVAVATVRYNQKTKVVTEFDIALNPSYAWATNVGATGDCGGVAGAYDVRNIVTHESGHPLGFADLTADADNFQTMFGYSTPQELFKRDLASGDLTGLSALYGP